MPLLDDEHVAQALKYRKEILDRFCGYACMHCGLSLRKPDGSLMGHCPSEECNYRLLLSLEVSE